MRRCFLSLSPLLLVPALLQAERPTAVETFLDQHCYECHDDLTDEGDLNLLDLAYDPSDPENLDRWIHVFSRVESGEMPPKEEPRPKDTDIAAFLESLGEPLLVADQARSQETGRSQVRRLNRAEFETALSDLFSIPLDVEAELPEDAKSHGFSTVGAALNVSAVQMEAYLNVIDQVLDEATTLYDRPEQRTHRLTFREENGIMQVYRKGGPFQVRDDGVAFFGTEKFSHLNATLSQYTVPHAGRYRIRLSAYALRSDEPVILSIRAGGTGHAESNHVPHIFLKHCAVNEGEPQIFEWEGHLERGHYFHVYPTSLRPMRFNGKSLAKQQDDYKGPAAVMQWMDVEGPIYDDWPRASHTALWGDLATEPIPGAKPNPDPISHMDEPPAKTAMPKLTMKEADQETGNRFIYSPDQEIGGEPIHRTATIPKPLHSTHQLVTDRPKEDAERLLSDFIERAFRRDVSEAEASPFVDLVHRWLADGVPFERAMRVGYKAILTSPGFLYHQGSLPGESPTISNDALAERLAFFLWNGLPDDSLRDLAAEGQLSDPATLRAEVERLLKDERSDRFLKDFTDHWLDLKLIDFTVPDEKLYPEYDRLLEWSLVAETRAYVRKMLDDDLGADHVIDSDFVMANWRLARHYNLRPMEKMELQPVSLPADSVRGGLMTQGSVLKVTANGTTTSPIVRGVWLLERILGVTPDPPPPGIPAIEPDIRGAVSIRDQMEKHRNSASCASCHLKIDPPGMAMESFDVIGGWRENYRALNEELADLKPNFNPRAPVPIRYLEGPEVDPSAEMPDGQPFADVHGFKELLLEDPRQIARGLVEKFVIYATGAEVTFSDRAEVEAILDRAEPSDYGFRTLIHEVVQSPLFRQK